MTKRRERQLTNTYRNLSLSTLREYLAHALILVHSGQPGVQQHVEVLRSIIAAAV